MPCSSSRTKRSPTPAFSERSTCVSLYFLRISFTYCAMIVLATIIYINYLKYHTLNMYPKCRFRVHVPKMCTHFVSFGYIFKAYHYARLTLPKSLYTLSVANIRNINLLYPFSGILFLAKEGIIPNREDYDIFLASFCFDMLRNRYFCREQAC